PDRLFDLLPAQAAALRGSHPFFFHIVGPADDRDHRPGEGFRWHWVPLTQKSAPHRWTAAERQLFGLSVDLHHDFFALADSGGAHDNADRLGNAALFADHAAHIVFRHAQMVDDGAILSHGVNRHPHRVLIFHTAAGNSNQQFLHLWFPPFGSALLTGSQPS